MTPTLFCMTVGNVEAETLLNTIQYSLPEVEAQTTVDALRDMDAKASVNKLADRVAEANADKVGEKLTDVISALLV